MNDAEAAEQIHTALRHLNFYVRSPLAILCNQHKAQGRGCGAEFEEARKAGSTLSVLLQELRAALTAD